MRSTAVPSGSLLLAALILSLGSTAYGNVALAEKLYQDGRRLFTSGEYDAACPKFAESYRLDPGGGTLLNLAACHEKQGKTATAWSEYELARQEFRRHGDEREGYAADQVNKLKVLLSFLTIEVITAWSIPGLVVRLDNIELGKVAWSADTPLDPGRHIVTASAPGYEDWSTTVNVSSNADVIHVVIPVLKKQKSSGKATASSTMVNTSAGATEPQSTEPKSPQPFRDSNVLSAPVVISGSATLAMGALFAVGGFFYLQEREKSQNTGKSPAYRAFYTGQANSWGVATLFGAGGVVSGAVLTTYFLASGGSDEQSAAAVSPWFGARAAGASIEGRF